MRKRTILVSSEFSKFPAGRYRSDGPYSGERFREDFLLPALQNNDTVTIQLDGTLGYGSSFLEEAFGGLVRKYKMASALLKSKLKIETSDPSLEKEVWGYINNARHAGAKV